MEKDTTNNSGIKINTKQNEGILLERIPNKTQQHKYSSNEGELEFHFDFEKRTLEIHHSSYKDKIKGNEYRDWGKIIIDFDKLIECGPDAGLKTYGPYAGLFIDATFLQGED